MYSETINHFMEIFQNTFKVKNIFICLMLGYWEKTLFLLGLMLKLLCMKLATKRSLIAVGLAMEPTAFGQKLPNVGIVFAGYS